jgi:indolepyruvate ferredoxin oxidoreductase alpha subunit
VHPLLKNEPGARALLLGNEAIVRGALEAGVGVVTGYPGTPASEVGDTFAAVAHERLLHFEYSVNEKVAYEAAYGACLGGGRALCSMKHLGLNVAADPLVTSAYVGVRGGFVVVSAADPGCHTSPNEQDHRYLARMSYIPVLDPSDPAEALEMAREAFAISERYDVPVLLRHTTRVAHTQGVVELGGLPERPQRTVFRRDPAQLVPVPASARRERRELIERMERARREAARSPFNALRGGDGRLGIVTTGVSHGYVMDAVDELGLQDARVLKLGMPYPLATDLVERLLEGCDTVLVVEEMEPFLEEAVQVVAARTGRRVRVRGKADATLPTAGEYGPGLVRRAVADAAGRKVPERRTAPAPELPLRPPILCAGCPHRASYTAVNLVVDERAVFMNDIGCYTLGLGRPLDTADVLLSMGSSLPLGGGTWAATGRKAIAFIGDSTFFHSGMTGLVDAAYNGHDLLVLVLDNRITGMTGHQPNPGMALTGMGTRGPDIAIEDVARSCGARHVAVVDPRDQEATVRAIAAAYALDGLRVVVSRAPCPVHEARTSGPSGVRYVVDPDRCRVCHITGECGAACEMAPERGLALVRAHKRVTMHPSGSAAGMAPCSASCPVNLCIPGFLAAYQAGDVEGAYAIIRRDLPLPSVVARVCPRPCEEACVRRQAEGAVAVNDVKRTVTDLVDDEQRASVRRTLLEGVTPSGRRVAVVGAGPAGLAAANDLALAGHEVTVLEATDSAGGLLAWAIPEFRLPRDVLEADVEDVLALGPQLRTNSVLGSDFTVESLLAEGFDAVFLAMGAGPGRPLRIEGEDAENVLDVIDLLRRVARGEDPRLGRRVVVVGGGDAAVDAARTCLRLGAQAVAIVYRRTLEDMPAAPHEVRRAREEGVFVEQCLMPVEVLVEDGRARGLVCRRTVMGPADETGRPRPVPVDGSDFEMDADTVIVATGQRGVDAAELGLTSAVAVQARGRVVVHPVTAATGLERVFAGGDAALGPGTVVGAIASGRAAAHSIDGMLRGEAPAAGPLFRGPEDAADAGGYVSGVLERVERIDPPRLGSEETRAGFAEVERGAPAEAARTEAGRCLGCGSCGRCEACIVAFGCPAFYRDDRGRILIDEVLCTGCGVCAQMCPSGAIVAVEAEP